MRALILVGALIVGCAAEVADEPDMTGPEPIPQPQLSDFDSWEDYDRAYEEWVASNCEYHYERVEPDRLSCRFANICYEPGDDHDLCGIQPDDSAAGEGRFVACVCERGDGTGCAWSSCASEDPGMTPRERCERHTVQDCHPLVSP